MVWFYSFLCQADEEEEGLIYIHHQAKFAILFDAGAEAFLLAHNTINHIQEAIGSL